MAATASTGAETATEPELREPASVGRRVAARSVDALLAVLVGFLIPVAVAVTLLDGTAAWLVPAVFLAPGVLALASLAILARCSATPGQAALGLYVVAADSGARAPLKALYKLLLQSLSFGLWVVITPLTFGPRNRSWFDRLAGVEVLDSHAPAPGSSGTRPATVPAPPDGWHSDGHLTQARVVDEGAASDQAAVADRGDGSPMIQAVPFDLARREPMDEEGPRQAATTPPAVSARQVRVRDFRPVSDPAAEPAVEDESSIDNLQLLMDDGTRVSLDRLIIVGRAPVQRPALGTARLVTLVDPAVSANHVAFGSDGGPWAMDLRSSNGTHLVTERGRTKLRPTERVTLRPGVQVRIGGRVITVEAS